MAGFARRQPRRAAQDVLQEVDRHVLQRWVALEVLTGKQGKVRGTLQTDCNGTYRRITLFCTCLRVLGDPVPEDGEDPHGRDGGRDGD